MPGVHLGAGGVDRQVVRDVCELGGDRLGVGLLGVRPRECAERPLDLAHALRGDLLDDLDSELVQVPLSGERLRELRAVQDHAGLAHLDAVGDIEPGHRRAHGDLGPAVLVLREPGGEAPDAVPGDRDRPRRHLDAREHALAVVLQGAAKPHLGVGDLAVDVVVRVVAGNLLQSRVRAADELQKRGVHGVPARPGDLARHVHAAGVVRGVGQEIAQLAHEGPLELEVGRLLIHDDGLAHLGGAAVDVRVVVGLLVRPHVVEEVAGPA